MNYDRIYHLALTADWEQAVSAGEYRVSTRNRTLEEEGFIHCSSSGHQLHRIASTFYRDLEGRLVVLTIDPWRVGAPVRWEPVGSDGEEYPHIYGPLPVDAVISAEPYNLRL